MATRKIVNIELPYQTHFGVIYEKLKNKKTCNLCQQMAVYFPKQNLFHFNHLQLLSQGCLWRLNLLILFENRSLVVTNISQRTPTYKRQTLSSFEMIRSNTKICLRIRHICLGAFSGQSYKHFTSVNYDPRVVIWAIFQSYDSRVVYYNCKVLYNIDHWSILLYFPQQDRYFCLPLRPASVVFGGNLLELPAAAAVF